MAKLNHAEKISFLKKNFWEVFCWIIVIIVFCSLFKDKDIGSKHSPDLETIVGKKPEAR